MVENLKDLVTFDETKIIEDENINGLWWPNGDIGSWHGPHKDWITHRDAILNNVPKKKVVVQAGGNMGLYPLLLSKRFERVYTFEPYPLSFYALSLNVTVDNVVKINAALADVNELVSMNVKNAKNLGMNKTVHEGNGTIPTFLIDQLNLDRCDLIWLDIEMAEDRALWGAMETISKFHPVLALENFGTEMERTLTSMGYVRGVRSVADTVFVYEGNT